MLKVLQMPGPKIWVYSI